MKILLLSAYHAGSHKSWCDGLLRHLGEHQFVVLSLPPRYFSWRIRGAPLTWSAEAKAELADAGYDLIIATSMTDLACLRGLNPALSSTPAILYFHENQFAYPDSAERLQAHRLEPQMVQLYSAVAADRLVFNSQFNRDSFLQGVRELLAKLPDGIPRNIVQDLTAKSQVIPVPIEPIPARVKAAQRTHLLWNHRWEHDKGPDFLLQVLRRLDPRHKLCVHVIGQQFRVLPKAFAEIGELLRQRGWWGHWGFVADRQVYAEILGCSHLVLSTAHHDFQGLSVLEAVSAGCLPVVPNELVYPEHFAAQYLYRAKDADDASRAIDRAVQHVLRAEKLAVPDVAAFYWPTLVDAYRSLLFSVTNS